MKKLNSDRESTLKNKPQLTRSDELELDLIEKKRTLNAIDYQLALDKCIDGILSHDFQYSIATYDALHELGYSFDEIMRMTLDLSNSEISGYSLVEDEASYWAEHRRYSKSLYVCSVYAGVMLGAFAIVPVFRTEAFEFLKGERTETMFSIFPLDLTPNEEHLLYISSVVVREKFRGTKVSKDLIMAGDRVIKNHLNNNAKCLGFFADAYSISGSKLCESLGMKNVNDSFYLKLVDR
ncbi:MAG: hypothetical protein GYB26_12740 [Gammaproteobacteria bacterium]|nr:hypothetical protein [Gammaproteobacteria bacterium]